MTWADGATYSGGWRKDKKHGAGRWAAADGETYDGQWEVIGSQPEKSMNTESDDSERASVLRLA